MLTYPGLHEVVIVLVFVHKFHFALCDTFHIVTSPSTPCPEEFTGVPCLTLQQYAINPSRSQNVTLLVDSGTYSLSTTLEFSNRYNFTMSSVNATIMCTRTNARFTFTTVANVYISGITFTDCSQAIHMAFVTSAIITKSYFSFNEASGTVTTSNYGGCLYVIGSSVLISESEFQNNRADKGGAVYSSSSNIAIDRSVFRNNTVNYGGALYCSGISVRLTIDSSLFAYNTACYDGGAIFYNRVLNMTNSTFIGNSAGKYCDSGTDINGGAIYSFQSSNDLSSVKQCQFKKNTARSKGGAIYMRVYKSLKNDGNYYESNEAGTSGGAIYLTGTNVFVNLSNSSFVSNTAKASGGAVSVQGNTASVIAFGSSFIKNTAKVSGGAASVEGTSLFASFVATESSFIKNTAMTEGGGAVYSNGVRSTITLSSSIFSDNTASYCGVLEVTNYNHNVKVTNSIFTYNIASGQTIGGGVACIRDAAIDMVNSTFRHNFAHSHAGAFYIDESKTTIEGCSFVNNTAAIDGGVIYTYIYPSNYSISGSQFSYNSAGNDGGVMYIASANSFVSIDGSIFDHNRAVNRGGVTAIIDSSMEMNGTNTFNNTAQLGGVISACNSQITFTDYNLSVTADPVQPFCMLYEGDIKAFNNPLPQVPDISLPTVPTPVSETTSASSVTSEPLTTSASKTTSIPVADGNKAHSLTSIILSSVSVTISIAAVITTLVLSIVIVCRVKWTNAQYRFSKMSTEEGASLVDMSPTNDLSDTEEN